MAAEINRVGYVVQTPHGYFRKMNYPVTENGSGTPVIFCEKYLLNATFIKVKEDAYDIWEVTGGKILTVMEHWTKKTEILKTEDPEKEENLFPAFEPDPSYYEPDCGYQPDPDWDESCGP